MGRPNMSAFRTAGAPGCGRFDDRKMWNTCRSTLTAEVDSPTGLIREFRADDREKRNAVSPTSGKWNTSSNVLSASGAFTARLATLSWYPSAARGPFPFYVHGDAKGAETTRSTTGSRQHGRGDWPEHIGFSVCEWGSGMRSRCLYRPS
jgi:hypothetical protein